jgi:hypothetical protein
MPFSYHTLWASLAFGLGASFIAVQFAKLCHGREEIKEKAEKWKRANDLVNPPQSVATFSVIEGGVYLVTGAAMGIGEVCCWHSVVLWLILSWQACARHLASHGAAGLVLFDRDPLVETVAKEISAR